ncbi:protein kinase [Candidatus Woesearchaeota archaeon]|nr:protein kinase [Candidatus Woesearchaeota archaeon]
MGENISPSDETVDFSKQPPKQPPKTTTRRVLKKWVGDYELLKVLGVGGMGAVYIAKHEKRKKKKVIEEIVKEVGWNIPQNVVEQMETIYEQKNSITTTSELSSNEIPAVVALKICESENQEFVERFKKEYQVTHRVRKSDKFAKVFEIGSEGSKQYYSMEYIPNKIPKNPSLEQSLEIIKQMCEGLTYAHSVKIFHRDLKPANVAARKPGEYVILDLGIAKDKTSTTITGKGMIMGTPQYMSPEQASGEEDVDGQTDVYALGVILHEFLTKKSPTYGGESDNMELFLSKVAAPYIDLDYLPSELAKIDKNIEAIILKCIAKNKKERYQNCEEIIEDINDYNAGKRVKALSYARKYKFKRFVKKNASRLKKIAAAGIIGSAIVFGGLTYQDCQGKNRLSELKQEYSALNKKIETQEEVSSLLIFQMELEQKLTLTRTAIVDYKGKSYEQDLKILETKIIEERKELDKKILNTAVKQLRTADTERSKELLSIVLQKSIEYKLGEIMNGMPENSVPDMTINGKYKFTDLSRDGANSYYPSMLRIGSEITHNKKFFEKYEKLAKLIKNNRFVSNNSLSGFHDFFLLLNPLYEKDLNPETRESLINYADQMLTRFRTTGEFFRAVDNVNSEESSKEQLQVESNIYLDLLVDAYSMTGDIKYWEAYSKHMETSLKAIREDGLVWRAVGIAQQDKIVKSQNREVKAGEVYYNVGFRDWQDKEDLFALTQPQAGISFVKYYSLTHDERFLVAARNIADGMLTRQDNFVWHWNLGKESEKDSFTTVMMANFLLDLSVWENDEVKKQIYYESAEKVLKEISVNYLSTELSYEGFVSGVQKPDTGINNESLTEADYFFFLAIRKLQHYERFEEKTFSLENTLTTSYFLREKTGALAIEDRTVMNISKDQTNLYFDFKSFSPSEKDKLEITIDNPTDDKDFYSFIFSPQGKNSEGIGPDNHNLTGFEWQISTERTEEHEYWTTRVTIPLSTINTKEFDLNVYRKSTIGISSFAYVQKYFRSLTQLERRDMFEIKSHKIKLQK